MGALTKEQLDAETAEWRAHREAKGMPVVGVPKENAKAVTTPNAALIKAIMQGLAPFIHDLEKQIAALQARITELEASRLKYCGVYQPSAAYQRGSVVTLDGSAFHATRNVSAERPGTSDAWQLMVKHGRDASSHATAHARNGSTLPPAKEREI